MNNEWMDEFTDEPSPGEAQSASMIGRRKASLQVRTSGESTTDSQ